MAGSGDSSSSKTRIKEKSINELIRAIDNCRGEYAFLIGAGTSKPAGIPTSGELIKEWQEEVYEDLSPEESFEEWVEETEPDIPEKEKYGFWFEKAYPSPAARRNHIRERVEDETPSFGTIILASMMTEGIVPLTLTTNFDDLLFDAFYLFLEDKPLVVDHEAIAPQFKLTSDRPTIVKLHGDYLYDNLKNTEDETSELEVNMHKTVSQSLSEYGLVVIGYGGRDDSIMDVLENETISDYGLFWCGRGDVDGLSDKAKSLLREEDNTYYVPIEDSEEVFAKFWQGLNDFSLPQPEEIKERADKRVGKLRGEMEKRKEEASGDEEELLEVWDAIAEAVEYEEEGDHEKAVQVYEDILEYNQERVSEEHAAAHARYAVFLARDLERYEEAERQFQRAIEIDSENIDAHYNYAVLLEEALERFEEAANHYEQALDINPDYAQAHYNYGLLLKQKLDQSKEAKEHFERAAELDPEYEENPEE